MASLPGLARVRAYPHAVTDTILAVAVLSSLVFIILVAGPATQPAGLARHPGHVALLFAHIAGGIVMLLGGALALRIGLTRQGFNWHRQVGFTYLAGGAIASLSALYRSFDTSHTPGLSTGTLAAAWLMAAGMAWRAAHNRRFDTHREWMIRSYVLAWTFVFCRFWTRAMPADLQGGETDMIWLTWIVPVLLCEVALQWRRGGRLAPART